jgi:hypothetical protein
MLETLAMYGAGIVVGAILTYSAISIRRPDGRFTAELDVANIAFVRGARDVLDEETYDDVAEQANDYCERWETPLRFDPDLEDGESQ